MSLPYLIAALLAGLCGAFAICRSAARRWDNHGIIDVLWSYAFIPAAVLAAAFEPGWIGRRLLVAGMVTLWSLRLGTHVLVRVARSRLRREWGRRFETKMTGFFQLQAASVVLLSAPFFAACRNPSPGLEPVEWAGLALWAVGVGGEAWADAQLAAFRRDPENHGRICAAGLWRLSRHPNYFFEWITWVGYFVVACGSPWGWIGVISPLCILYFLLCVTGIPLTEQLSVQSKGDRYREYQRTTSAFVPWFPRTGKT